MIAELIDREDFRGDGRIVCCLALNEKAVNIVYTATEVLDGAVAVALILAELVESLRRINELQPSLTAFLLAVCYNPTISGNAGIVEDIVG